MKFKLAYLTSTLFYIGHLPKAPGTWATLISAIIIYVLLPTLGLIPIIVTAAIFFAGLISVNYLEKGGSPHDDGKIVIDELLGFLLAVLFIPKSLLSFALAFVLFRIFDIWKPYPIKAVDEKVKGGLGVMLDDAMAGIVANIIARIILAFVK